jgi:hypothetical protein
VIILPAIMLVGAFFIMRWANKNDKGDDGEDLPTTPSEGGPMEDRPVGFVLPSLGGAPRDADQTTR